MRKRAYGVALFFLASGWALSAQNKNAVLDLKLSTSGNDIAFDKGEIEAPFGSTIKIRFFNQAAKGSEILHNVAILKPGTYDEFIKDLQKSGYDLEKMSKHPSIITMTKTLSPGDEESVSFLPSEPGSYPYVCIMAGHGDMLGMKGVLKVKK